MLDRLSAEITREESLMVSVFEIDPISILLHNWGVPAFIHAKFFQGWTL